MIMRTRIFLLYLLACFAAGCYPDEFDRKTWGPVPELELSTPGVTLQAAEGSSETVTVATNYNAWQAEVAEEGQAWCSVEQQDDLLVIKATENTGEKERTTVVTVTVGKSRKESKEIAVTQLGTAPRIVVSPTALSFELGGGTQEVQVTTNVATWSAAVSIGSEWCSVSSTDNRMGVTVTPYSGRELREALITLTGNGTGATAVTTLKVVQVGTDPVLTVSDPAAFDASGGTQALLVTTNRGSWTVTVPSTAGWCRAEQDGNRLQLAATENTGLTGRSCEVLVTAGSGDNILMYSLMVAQLGMENELILSADEVSFNGQASMQTVSVFTQSTWTAETDAAWCTLLQGENTLTLYAEQNPSTTETRRGTVTVTAEGLPAQEISISQLPDISVILSTDTLSMPAGGGREALTVVTNQEIWTAAVSGTVSWCTVEMNGNQLIVMTVENTGDARSAVVNVTAGTGEAVKTIPLVVQQEGMTSDRAILMAFYEATGGEHWTNKGNWGSDLPLGEWYGVTTELIEPETEAGEPVERVVELDLAYNNLTGELPALLGSLDELRHLDIAGNQLAGEIPSAWGNWEKLVYFNCESNQLSGVLPTTLSHWSNLVEFYAYDNRLSGKLPDGLENWKDLQIVDLSSNQLKGEIPVALSQCTALTFLDLGDNQLTGQIPSELSRLPRLEELYLCENYLTGYVPRVLTALPGWGTGIVPETDIFPQKNGYLQMEPEEGVYSVLLLLEGDAREVNQAAGTHLYGVQVLSRAAGSADNYQPYGYGIYSDSTRVWLNLEEGNEYSIYTTLVVDGQSKVQPGGSLYAAPFAVTPYAGVVPPQGYVPGTPVLDAFVRDAVQGLGGISRGETVMAVDGKRYERPGTTRYFGERLNYMPAQDGVLSVDMVAILFAVTCEVENLTEGRIRVEIEGAPSLYIDADAAEHSAVGVYTFANPNGNWMDENYSETLEVTFVWEKPNGLERTLSSQEVTFVRGNMHTLHTVFNDDGMWMDMENKPLTDGEVIEIEGTIWL